MKRREADLRKVSTKPDFVFHRAGKWNVGMNTCQTIFILKPPCGLTKLEEKEKKKNTHSCLTFPSDYLIAKRFIRTYRGRLKSRRKFCKGFTAGAWTWHPNTVLPYDVV